MVSKLAEGVTSMRLMFAAALAIGSLVSQSAFPCTASVVLRQTLDRNSDVIATGEIRIVARQERRNGDEKITSGSAELADPTVLRNRPGARPPFTFTFEFIEFDGCVFGEIPIDGRRATVYLRSSEVTPGQLELYYIEYLE